MFKAVLCLVSAIFAFLQYAMPLDISKLKLQTLGKREHLTIMPSRLFHAFSTQSQIIHLGGAIFMLAWLISDLEAAFYFTAFGLSYCFYEHLHFLAHTKAPKTPTVDGFKASLWSPFPRCKDQSWSNHSTLGHRLPHLSSLRCSRGASPPG